jgi:hypothetical protein
VSLIKTNRTRGGAAAIGARAKDRAMDAYAQAIPAGKRAGTTAVQGVRQGVQDAREWAAPRLEDAVHGAREWAAPRLEDAVHGAREWAAPRLEDAADAVTGTVAPKVAETVTGTLAPKVSSALRSTARQVRPADSRTGFRRMMSLRWLFAVGAVAAAAGAGAAIAMRRRYASATAEAKNDAAESPEAEAAPPLPGESAADAARRSEVNGRVSTPDV